MSTLWAAFSAFNVNGASYLMYNIGNNLWYLLIAASAVACIVMYLKEELDVTVREEQQAI